MEASKEAKYEEWFHAIDIDGDGYINSEACLEMIYRRIAIQAQELGKDNSNSADANLNMESFKGMLEEDHNREFFQVIFPVSRRKLYGKFSTSIKLPYCPPLIAF